MGEQKIDGVLAQVPRWRTITTRLAPGEPGDGIVGTDEIGLLFLPALLRGGNMGPAVMRHLVSVPHHRLTGAWVALDGKSRDEPGGADAEGLEQGQDAPRADEAELSARERRRGRHATGDEARLGIEVEGQAHDVAGHLCLPERGHGCNRHSIVSPPPARAFPKPRMTAWQRKRSESSSMARPAASARLSIWPMPSSRSSMKAASRSGMTV